MSDYSLNEVRARAKLAAKGAGYSWGMAEEVSRSIYWLVSRGLPGPAMLAALLDSIPEEGAVCDYSPKSLNTTVQSTQDWLCPIAGGCMATDVFSVLPEQGELQFNAVRCPLLLTPFIAEIAAESNVIVELQAGEDRLVTDGSILRYSSEQLLLEEQVSQLSCRVLNRLDETGGYTSSPTERVVVVKAVWDRLDVYARKTYAPATDASRLLGAGAGLHDND